MPSFNGTGPDGQGPMTGRGLGNCVNVVKDGVKTVVEKIGLGRGGRPRSGGRGFGRGFGRRR